MYYELIFVSYSDYTSVIYWKIILWQVFPIMVDCFSGIGQGIISRIQRRIQNPVKRIRWIFLRKYLAIFRHYLLLRKASSKMFDRVLSILLEYAHFVYIIMCIGVSPPPPPFPPPPKKTKNKSFTPLILAKPPLKSANCPNPPFLGNPRFWFFVNISPKNRIFQSALEILKFFILKPLPPP